VPVRAESTTEQPSAPPVSLPGAASFPSTLQQHIKAALAAKGPAYQPRTRHLNPDGSPQYTNRLIFESSPYLLQHAHNPVNWYAWGDDAFAQAKKANKPVLLSIGYSTCHWCHVMEQESFEDPAIAEIINRYYIAIKVDRERRPDLDALYMTTVQMLTGSGGWPMTVWLTPERRPFFGGTYFPPHDGQRGVDLGLMSLLQRLQDVYHQNPKRVAQTAQTLTQQLQQALAPHSGDALPGSNVLSRAVDSLKNTFDEQYGGFGNAPKFPSSVTLELLLRYYRRTGDKAALSMVERTLEAMAAGGIYDHIGGGFHRYATDRQWLVPHFEKMHYDNGLSSTKRAKS
jgi:hypothetical protein